jgi:hypothetical protein
MTAVARHTGIAVFGLVPIICGALHTQEPGSFVTKASPTSIDKRLETWKTGLRQSFKAVHGNVVIDLGGSELGIASPRAEMSEAISESQFARLMSAELHRKLTAKPDGWLMTREPGFSKSDLWLNAEAWLKNVDDDQLKKLCTTGIAFADLSDDTKDLFARMCSNPGLQQKMANGDFASAGVRMAFYATGFDGSGKSVSIPLTSLAKDSSYEKDLRDKLERSYQRPATVPQTFSTPSGDLDLTSGEVMNLDAIAKLIKTKYKETLEFDPRLGQSNYYLQGRFTEETLVDCVKEATRALPTEIDLSSDAYKKAVDRLFRERVAKLLDPASAPKGLSLDDALNQKQLTAKDLASMFPELQSGLDQRQISPDSVLTLSACLSFQLVGDGAYLAPGSPPNTSAIGNSWGIALRP